MKLELKSIKHSPSLSEETEAFTADLFVDGKKVAHIRNDGRGGCHRIDCYDRAFNPVIQEAEAFCKTLPPHVGKFGSLDIDLDFKISILLEEHLAAKDEAKRFRKALCFINKEGEEREISWKSHTIPKLLKLPQGQALLKQKIFEIKKKGGTVQNTNLGSLLP